MSNPVLNRATKLLCFFALTGISLCAQQTKVDKKPTPLELVAKHLESIGPAEGRGQVRGMRIKGTCLLTVRQGGSGQVMGQAVMASQGSQNLISMTFDAPAYPSESMRFDGKKFTASQFRPGFRTSLAQFFLTNDVVFREGLIGGTLSASWPLLDLKQKNPKLEYAGLKKIEGQQLHALSYKPHKGSDLKITIFLGKESFQHVRTEYERTIVSTTPQRIGETPEAQRGRDAHIEVVEEFSDFKPEGGLNLPHTYKFELSIQSEVRPALVDWIFNLTDFTLNAPLDIGEFSERN